MYVCVYIYIYILRIVPCKSPAHMAPAPHADTKLFYRVDMYVPALTENGSLQSRQSNNSYTVVQT